MIVVDKIIKCRFFNNKKKRVIDSRSGVDGDVDRIRKFDVGLSLFPSYH